MYSKNIKLLLELITKYCIGVTVTMMLLFIPAGTIYYFNGWLLLGLLFIPMCIVGIVLFIKDKELLKKRLKSKEKYDGQKIIIFISTILFIGGFIVAGLDYRYNWSNISIPVVLISSIILLISYAIYIEVLKENKYLSRTIEVSEQQIVIDTGLYGIVRHPMYLATTTLFLSFPLVLGSWISFIIFLLFPFLLVKRIKSEEEILERELNGYNEYKKKVKYKMIPFIW